MTELEELQYLIDTSDSFDSLIASASRSTNSMWDDNAEDILSTRNTFFRSMDINEYFNKYLVWLAWATLMGKVLGKIHGNGYDDDLAGIKIPGFTKHYIIYHSPRPWMIRAQLDKSSKQLYIKESISIRDPLKGETKRADIEFRLEDIRIGYDSETDTYFPRLLDSTMSVALLKEDTDERIYKDIFLVKDFKPGRLTEIVKTGFVYIGR